MWVVTSGFCLAMETIISTPLTSCSHSSDPMSFLARSYESTPVTRWSLKLFFKPWILFRWASARESRLSLNLWNILKVFFTK